MTLTSGSGAIKGRIYFPAGTEVNGTVYFNGVIDEVAIFNVELEEEDIQTIMNDGLERASGLTAVDLSGKLISTWGNVKVR